MSVSQNFHHYAVNNRMIVSLRDTGGLIDLTDCQNLFIYHYRVAMRRDTWGKAQSSIESVGKRAKYLGKP